MMFGQEMMDLMENILRGGVLSVVRRLEKVSELRVQGAMGGWIEDWDVHPYDEEIGCPDVEEHGTQAARLRGIWSEGDSGRETWAANEELPTNGRGRCVCMRV
jgi:hypothetical protein